MWDLIHVPYPSKYGLSKEQFRKMKKRMETQLHIFLVLAVISQMFRLPDYGKSSVFT